MPFSRSMLRVGIIRFDLSRLYRLWSAPAFARPDATVPTPPVILSRFVYKPWRTCSFMSIARTHTRCMDTENVSTEAPKEVMLNADTHTKCLDKENVSTQEPTEPIKKLMECKTTNDDVYYQPIIPHSTHRDGVIYKSNLMKQEFWEGDIADRNETHLEPMMYSKATEWCLPDAEYCMLHIQQHMLQFFSVLLPKSPINTGLIQLYGYIAARDVRDGRLNYIVNYRRDDPIAVQQGSLIEMTGPKRGIVLSSVVLVEFDMRIKNGMQEDDDQQLIDGVVYFYEQSCAVRPTLHRICGDCGAVDMKLAIVQHAVEATIEVVILEVLSGLSLYLSSFIDFVSEYEEIQLFHGNFIQTGALRRFVVAAPWSTELLLKFKVGNDGCGWQSRHIKFRAEKHGCASRQIKLKVAAISVKVTWSTV